MKKTLKFLLIFPFFLLFYFYSLNSYSGLLINPYLGLHIVDGHQETPTVLYTYNSTGLVFGGRFGLEFLSFQLGVDYSMGSDRYDMESKNSLTSIKSTDKISKSQLGIFVGYDIIGPLKFWGTYFLSAKLEGKDLNTATRVVDSTETYKGTGYAICGAWSIIPFLDLSVEYRAFEYNEWEDTNASVKSGTFGDSSTPSQKNIKMTEIMASLSVPFSL